LVHKFSVSWEQAVNRMKMQLEQRKVATDINL